MSDSKTFSVDDFGINLDAGGYSLGIDVDKQDAPIAKTEKSNDQEDAPEKKGIDISKVIETIKPYALPVGVALILLIGFAAMSGRK